MVHPCVEGFKAVMERDELGFIECTVKNIRIRDFVDVDGIGGDGFISGDGSVISDVVRVVHMCAVRLEEGNKRS